MEITQADREAAATYWAESRIGNDETQRRYLTGEADSAFIVQAFARHRIAAEQAERARIAAMPAFYHLRHHQQQADMDGVMVTVSRQALDEVLDAIELGEHL